MRCVSSDQVYATDRTIVALFVTNKSAAALSNVTLQRAFPCLRCIERIFAGLCVVFCLSVVQLRASVLASAFPGCF